MKKSIFILALLCIIAIGSVSSQQLASDSFNTLGAWRPAYGTWKADGSLVQSNTNTGLAVINRPLSQSGVYELEFSVKYIEGGFKDQAADEMGKYHGGFGIHIGVDRPAGGRAWGNGKSYLLWFNLDTEVPVTSKHYGFRAQVYKSESHSKMELIEDYNLEILAIDEVMENLDYLQYDLPFRMIVNTNDGEIRVYDPTDEGYYYYFTLDPKLLKGSYVSFRTNKVSMAFDDFKVTKLR